MIPFLHFGPLSIPTFGLMVATGLFTAAYVLQADFMRRNSKADAFLIIGIAGLAGIVGARLYHVLESPQEFFAHPWPMIASRYGFAWFGGLIGGFIALILMARHEKIPMLEFLDACAPAACVGYAIGRIGCLLSGDGDYGRATSLPWGMSFPNGVESTTGKCLEWGLPADCKVHPTPIYEFLIWLVIALILWKLASGPIQKGEKTGGRIFFYYLILTGVARFLVELIRINPRSFFGMSNAQTASVASVIVGLAFLVSLRKPRLPR
ncbi:MAG TPA: prolipoprotein diacylglyceryl transferase [Candidatus Angelobacter sp.]|nr:prolipoprotein diacylglyceryl transferase [Candidatus Angelobacter sp.]